jgi:hypothetical protein
MRLTPMFDIPYCKTNSAEVARKFVNEIKNRKPYTRELTSKDLEVLRYCITTHYNYSRFESLGIKTIVRLETDDGWQKFAIVHTDGSESDFSTKRLFTTEKNKVTLLRDRAKKAFRYSVINQITTFKKSRQLANGMWESDYSGEQTRTPHVDHATVFWKLLDNFLDVHSISLEDVPIVEVKAYSSLHPDYYPWDLVEPIKSLWNDYHREKAILRILTAEENSNTEEMLKCAANARKYRRNKKK